MDTRNNYKIALEKNYAPLFQILGGVASSAAPATGDHFAYSDLQNYFCT
jgi:hypothetical protein